MTQRNLLSRLRLGQGEGANWRLILSIGSPVALLLVWQTVTALRIFPPEVLVSPAAVLAAFAEIIRTGELQRHLSESLNRLVWGSAAAPRSVCSSGW